MGIFWVRGEVHTRIWRGNSPTRKGYSGDKIRNKFNGQAWGHFRIEEIYIQYFGGETPHTIQVTQVIKSGINLMDRHGAILG
jgi:hypothetical protein